MKKLLTICLVAYATSASCAQSFDKDKLDTYFSVLEKSNKFMGSVALSENGKIIYTRAVGYSDVGNKKKSDSDTKFRIGSISKTFTSVLIFKAIEEKKLMLATKINTFFPALKNSDKISIGNLLNHRSGIHNFTDDDDYKTYNTQKKTEVEMLKIIAAGGSDFEPDSKAEYSNSNYVLLSYILQKVYKKSYSELLQEKIINPIGLKNTFLGGKINVKNNESLSYKYDLDWKKETETDISIPLGAGGIVSTPSDLLQFASALFNGKVLSSKYVDLMKINTDNYGYGLFQIPFGDRLSYGHAGGIDDFSSVFSYFPGDKIGFAMISNGSNLNNNDISLIVLSAAFNKPYKIPEFNTIALSASELKIYTGTYSSKAVPLKIEIRVENGQLNAQATGQSAFPLEATAKDTFKFEQAGIELSFDTVQKTMLLNQGGGTVSFTKE